MTPHSTCTPPVQKAPPPTWPPCGGGEGSPEPSHLDSPNCKPEDASAQVQTTGAIHNHLHHENICQGIFQRCHQASLGRRLADGQNHNSLWVSAFLPVNIMLVPGMSSTPVFIQIIITTVMTTTPGAPWWVCLRCGDFARIRSFPTYGWMQDILCFSRTFKWCWWDCSQI